MPVSPDDFLNSAARLKSGGGEMDTRNSVSRAYYGAYHAALEALVQLPEPPPKANGQGRGVHATFIAKLQLCNDRRLNKLGDILHTCYDRRAKADYRLALNFPPVFATMQHRECLEVVRRLRELQEGP